MSHRYSRAGWDELVACWRVNYGLDKRSPQDAWRWWNNNGQPVTAGAVAALGLCLERLEQMEAKLKPARRVKRAR